MNSMATKNIDKLYKKWQFWAIVGGAALVVIVLSVMLISKSNEKDNGDTSSKVAAICETGKTYYMPDGTYKIPEDFPVGTYQITAPGTDNSFGLNGYKNEEDIANHKYDQYFHSSNKNNGTDKNMITLKEGMIYVATDTDGQLQMLCDPANTKSSASSPSSSSQSSDNSSTSSSDWRQWLKDYEAWVDKYIATYKKYQNNPTDTSLVSEYTKLAAEASEWAEKANDIKTDLSTSDATEFANTYARILDKISKM